MTEKHEQRDGGPYDRGAADKYYGRSFNPHYFDGAQRMPLALMTEAEVAAYKEGYSEEKGQKDYGYDGPELADDEEELA